MPHYSEQHPPVSCWASASSSVKLAVNSPPTKHPVIVADSCATTRFSAPQPAESPPPLRRHSVSAPAFLALSILDSCQNRLSQLSTRVEYLTVVQGEEQVARARSMPELNKPEVIMLGQGGDTEQPTEAPPHVKTKKSRICHQCHTPLDDQIYVGGRQGLACAPCHTGRGVKVTSP